jgi:hypothetical protein
MANLGDVYLSTSQTPANPVVNDSITWGEDWTKITLPYEVEIPKNGAVYMALENQYDGNKIKQVTLEFESISGGFGYSNPAGFAGYPTSTGLDPKAWNVSSIIYPDKPELFTLKGTINPQPSWEWIKLRYPESSTSVSKIKITNYSSSCVPEPSTIFILSFGGLFLGKYKTKKHL